MKEMQLFTPSRLVKGATSSLVEDDIGELCINYSLDATAVLKELEEFRPLYSQVHNMVNMDDLLSVSPRSMRENTTTKVSLQLEDPDVTDTVLFQSLEDDEEDTPAITTATAKWVDHSFMKPLRVLSELSGFDNLSCMYKNLASLAVTSCSAERAMSKVKIVKDHLRSTMLDDWFSALLVLAAEKDLLDSLSENDVVDKFARCSLSLQKQLMYSFHERLKAQNCGDVTIQKSNNQRLD